MAFDHTAFSTLLAHRVGILEQQEKAEAVATTGFLARYDADQAAGDGYYVDRFASSLKSYRDAKVALQRRAREILEPLFLAYLDEVIGKPASSITNDSWNDIVQHFVTNSYTVDSRAFTRGDVDAGGPENYTNAGGGTCYRQLTDDRNNAIESSDPGIVEVKCVKQLGEGVQRYRSEWVISHRSPAPDELERRSMPLKKSATLIEQYPGEELLTNPSFDVGSNGTLAAAPSGWTLVSGTASNNALSSATYHRKDGDRTPLAFRANETLQLSQYLRTNRKAFDWWKPYFCAIAYERETGSFDGTLAINVGGQATSVALAAQTGWNWLVGAMADDRWPRVFREDDPAVDIVVTRTSGYLFLDTVIVRPMTLFDGCWYAVLGNTDDFHRDDRFTFTDTVGTETYIQKWVYRAFGRHLPHTATPSISDPTIG